MLQKERDCFLILPSAVEQQKLIPAKTVSLQAKQCVIAVNSSSAAAIGQIEVGSELAVRAEWRNKFHQQFAKVLGMQNVDGQSLIEVELLSEPTNCESRTIFRVNVVMQNISCNVGEERGCSLADVSVEGLSVIVRRQLQIGRSVSADFHFEQRTASGAARVMSEKKLADGSFRYGLLASEKTPAMRRSLETISGLLQRHQLRRLAGAA